MRAQGGPHLEIAHLGCQQYFMPKESPGNDLLPRLGDPLSAGGHLLLAQVEPGHVVLRSVHCFVHFLYLRTPTTGSCLFVNPVSEGWAQSLSLVS